jgi:hypothetical protein
MHNVSRQAKKVEMDFVLPGLPTCQPQSENWTLRCLQLQREYCIEIVNNQVADHKEVYNCFASTPSSWSSDVAYHNAGLTVVATTTLRQELTCMQNNIQIPL